PGDCWLRRGNDAAPSMPARPVGIAGHGRPPRALSPCLRASPARDSPSPPTSAAPRTGARSSGLPPTSRAWSAPLAEGREERVDGAARRHDGCDVESVVLAHEGLGAGAQRRAELAQAAGDGPLHGAVGEPVAPPAAEVRA